MDVSELEENLFAVSDAKVYLYSQSNHSLRDSCPWNLMVKKKALLLLDWFCFFMC